MYYIISIIITVIFIIIRSTPPSWPNKAGLNVCTSVRPSVHKNWAKFGVYVEVDVWYTTVCRATHCNVKVKVAEVQTYQKWLISKSFFFAVMHVIKRLMVNYDTPRQYQNSTGQIYHIYPGLASYDPQT